MEWNLTSFIIGPIVSLRKIPRFHLITWCGNFVKMLISGELP